ncbi:DUF3574 domain-containing protein [Sphingomonas sp. MMS24-J13]|uniref:DUF3574 domain-containing protein n=1 Tax=Sphingomonas sp. MMS24-J13 TaxID=3238686 RepID=UPI00384B6299
MGLLKCAGGLLLASLCLASPVAAGVASPARRFACASPDEAFIRTTLYFGLGQRLGWISARQWRSFLRHEVTVRFPQGFTVLDAQGQWRGESGMIMRERSKVLLIIHRDTPESWNDIHALIALYRARYDQELVLQEDAEVCATF